MDTEPIRIDDFLKGLAGQRVQYCPNPGNAGDALIAVSTYDLFRKHGIQYSLVGFAPIGPRDLAGEVVIYGGGGSLNNYFQAAARFVERHLHTAKRLIILPQTIAGHEELLGSLGSNVDVLCRERISYEHARSNARRARVHLCDDLVFDLDLQSAMRHRPTLREWLPRRRRWMANEAQFAALRLKKVLLDHGSVSRTVLHCFRGGPDRPDIRVPADNIDVSALLGRALHTEAEARFTAGRFLRFLASFDTIHASRLHVAIAGALLGKAVHMYPNRFYKNQAVYEFSLKERFPNVIWMGPAQ